MINPDDFIRDLQTLAQLKEELSRIQEGSFEVNKEMVTIVPSEWARVWVERISQVHDRLLHLPEAFNGELVDCDEEETQP